MKKCSKCNTDKSLENFTKRKNGSNYPWCKPCHALHKKITRENNLKENNRRVQELRAVKREERQKYVIDYLKNHPCISCGEKDILVLQFDHRDPSTKLYNISNLVSYALSELTLKTELDKCDVLCANCHSKRTAYQVGSFKIKYL